MVQVMTHSGYPPLLPAIYFDERVDARKFNVQRRGLSAEMIMSKQEIESAFPTDENNYEKVWSSPGMTLRDYFAAKAMQGLLANTLMGDAALHSRAPDWLTDISVGAYEFADAMLRAREAS